jgi:eukaryotic-like serine/threonine-protein kinase
VGGYGWTAPGYTHHGELGLGIGGRVMLAAREDTGALVAIKYLTGRLCADQAHLDRLRETVRTLAELDDPHIVRPHECVERPRSMAIVMDLVDGITLQHLIGAEGTLGPRAALTVLKRSLHGLAAAHEAGVVHGGCKPTNVLIGADGRSRLTDFGIAGPGLFGAGVPVYLAPERWAGSPATPAADVYAATAMFHECLTGRPPYEGTTALLGEAHRTAPIPAEQTPEALRALLTRGLAKDPAARPPIDEFLADLEEVAVAAYGPGWEQRGHDRLAGLAAPLARLFPLAQALHRTTARGTHRTTTRSAAVAGLRNGWLTTAVGAMLIGLLTGAALALTADRQPQDNGPFTIHRVVPEPVPSTNPVPTLTPAAATEAARSTPRLVTPRSTPVETGPESPGAVTPTAGAGQPHDDHPPPADEPSSPPDIETPPIIVDPSLPLGPGSTGDPSARSTFPGLGLLLP